MLANLEHIKRYRQNLHLSLLTLWIRYIWYLWDPPPHLKRLSLRDLTPFPLLGYVFEIFWNKLAKILNQKFGHFLYIWRKIGENLKLFRKFKWQKFFLVSNGFAMFDHWSHALISRSTGQRIAQKSLAHPQR